MDLLAEAVELTEGAVNGVEVATFPLFRRAECLGIELLEIQNGTRRMEQIRKVWMQQ